MLGDLFSILLCLWLAARLRRGIGAEQGPGAWEYATRSMRWGMLLVTVSMLGYFGVLGYVKDRNFPSALSLILCTGLTALVVMGSGLEITGNVIVDAVIMALGLACGCFTVINGLSDFLEWLNTPNLIRWLLACIGIALVVRAIFWLREDR
jgi:hypothetical protein